MRSTRKLTRLADSCKGNEWCPAIDLTDRGTLIFTGPDAAYDGLRIGQGEHAVELPINLVKEAMRALDAR